MIYCVWYPSGGFGHFVNAVLTLHGDNFARPSKTLEFSANGDSHQLDLLVPKYLHEHWDNNIEFQSENNYSVLIDNGINNESDKFKSTFPSATIIKICYSDQSWPIVAHTMIVKAMQGSVEDQLPTSGWATEELWARREKFFLFLRDHHLRSAWRPTDTATICVDEMLDYHTFFNALNLCVKTENFSKLWKKWYDLNFKYIAPVNLAKSVIHGIRSNNCVDLRAVTDVWTQSVIYYYIWLEYNFEVPHNDCSDWFINTNEISIMLAKHGV
jgi:hypothetical protein